jgi:hypothetical protein
MVLSMSSIGAAWGGVASAADSEIGVPGREVGRGPVNAQYIEQYIEGYTSAHSFAPGETIGFHVSTDSPTYSIEVYRVEFPWWVLESPVATVAGLPGAFYPKPADPWDGADWPRETELVVGESWVSGDYIVDFITEDGSSASHPFYIRPTTPGATSRIAYIGNFTTLAAYNDWGGRNFYTQPRIYKASLLRPFHLYEGLGRSNWNRRLHSHLEQYGYPLEYITEWDVEEDPEILRNYDIVVLAGHHEYVSTTFYDALQDHHNRGGHLAMFDADGLYWQIRYENDGAIVVGYKDDTEEADPLFGYIDCLATAEWGSDLLHRPAEALRGVQRNPLYFYFESGDYRVVNAAHWVFEGTGLVNGDVFGEMTARGEQDTVTAASPQLDILLHGHRDVVKPGKIPPDGVTAAEMYAVYYADTPEYGFPEGNGGMVFTAGVISGWIRSLNEQPGAPVVERATRNILDRMLATPPPPHNGEAMAVYCEPCYPDLDGSGSVDTIDFLAYLSAWSLREPIGDWDHDGVFNTIDFLAFLSDWAAGC